MGIAGPATPSMSTMGPTPVAAAPAPPMLESLGGGGLLGNAAAPSTVAPVAPLSADSGMGAAPAPTAPIAPMFEQTLTPETAGVSPEVADSASLAGGGDPALNAFTTDLKGPSVSLSSPGSIGAIERKLQKSLRR